MKIKLRKAGRTYTISFDEYGDLDTVEWGGVLLPSTNAVVMLIAKNAEAIRSGRIPAGFLAVAA